jgi:hypothetical protein
MIAAYCQATIANTYVENSKIIFTLNISKLTLWSSDLEKLIIAELISTF